MLLHRFLKKIWTLRWHITSGICVLVLTVLWGYALTGMGPEKHQGEVYRILYVHVPSAFSAFVMAFFLLVQSILALKKSNTHFSHASWGKAYAEVGLLFTLLTLITGSLWGRPTWGVWWTWDARLTTTLILGLLYAGYLVLWSSLEEPQKRAKFCAVLGILIAIDVPIIYKSVSWWRTLHQPPSLFQGEQNYMSLEIKLLLYACSIFTIITAWMLCKLRYSNLAREKKLQSLTYSAF